MKRITLVRAEGGSLWKVGQRGDYCVGVLAGAEIDGIVVVLHSRALEVELLLDSVYQRLVEMLATAVHGKKIAHRVHRVQRGGGRPW